MYSIKQMYVYPNGNADFCETICRVNNIDEAKQFWKLYCEINSTEEFFDSVGYNCFYIEDEDGMVEESYNTGFFKKKRKVEKKRKELIILDDEPIIILNRSKVDAK